MKKANYILLEGLDASGKGTQLKLLEDYFSKLKIPFISVIEPGGTKPGKAIRKILLDTMEFNLHPLTELFLYQADRVETFQRIIIPNLEKRISVLEDRSWPSTCAYQGVAEGINKTHKGLVDYLNKISTFGLLPDLLFIIDENPFKLLKKIIKLDRMESKEKRFYKEVRRGYFEIAEKFPDISIIIPYQEGNPQAMQQEIRQHLKERLGI